MWPSFTMIHMERWPSFTMIHKEMWPSFTMIHKEMWPSFTMIHKEMIKFCQHGIHIPAESYLVCHWQNRLSPLVVY